MALHVSEEMMDVLRKAAGVKTNGKGNGALNNYNVSIRTAESLRLKVFDPIKFIVRGYITEGATILAGRPKLGKSWLMLSIGLAVSRGGTCLGDIQCEQGDVLYLALEDNERRLQSRMTRLIGAYGQEWPSRFHYATEWPRANAGGLEKIREWIDSVEKPRLVVVDVLAMFRSPRQKDQQPYEADYAAIQGLQAIASQTGVAIVIVHHLRKSQAEVDPFEKVSGTLGLSGAADTVLILDRDGQGSTLYGRGRDIEEIETAVQFSKETCQWTVIGKAEEVRRSDERGAILDALADAAEPLSPREIADVTGHSYDAVRKTLSRMTKAGEVSKTKRGQYASCDTPKTPCHNGHNVTTDQSGCDTGQTVTMTCHNGQNEYPNQNNDIASNCDLVTLVTGGRDEVSQVADGLDIPTFLRRDVPQENEKEDPLKLQVVKDRVRKREAIKGPRIGDWVIMPDGSLQRLTGVLGEYNSWHHPGAPWPVDGIQDPTNRNRVNHPKFCTDFQGWGKFALGRDGRANHSGGNDSHDVSRRAKLVDTGQIKLSQFMVFKMNDPELDPAVNFELPCRVYRLEE